MKYEIKKISEKLKKKKNQIKGMPIGTCRKDVNFKTNRINIKPNNVYFRHVQNFPNLYYFFLNEKLKTNA